VQDFCHQLCTHPVKVAVDVGAGIGIMSAMAVMYGHVGHVHAIEAWSGGD